MFSSLPPPLGFLTGVPGYLELIVIAGVALLIFGRRLPGVARDIGRSLSSFKRGLREVKDDMDVDADAVESDAKAETKDDAPKTEPKKEPDHPDKSDEADTSPPEGEKKS